MRSSQNDHFRTVPAVQLPRSRFDLSRGHKTAFDSGLLIPVLVEEALPGDTFNVSGAVFARMATPIFPVMDNLYLDLHFFAVPLRLVWDNFQKFMGEQLNPGDSTDYLVPQVVAGGGGFGVESLFDYMGIPPSVASLSVSALFPRAYNLIWNEWFRDENLQNQVAVPKGDGPDTPGTYSLLRRGKRPDYFTTCLPWPQKGPGVTLPLSGSASIVPTNYPTGPSKPTFNVEGRGTDKFTLEVGAGTSLPANSASLGVTMANRISGSTGGNIPVGSDLIWQDAGLRADLTTAQAVTINTMREAFQVQQLLERDARGGTRYTELVRSHFGVTSPDARLQRPEYLGGSELQVIINPVTQNTPTGSGSTPMGTLSGFGHVSGNKIGFSKSFVEHSIIIGLASVRADITYQQGVHRMFRRKTRYDFFWPSLQHLGEQAVKNVEIYAQGPAVLNAGGTPKDDDVFGYQERFAEYRTGRNYITGKFRSGGTVALDAWHLGQYFSAMPNLNDAFIQDNPPVGRVVAVPSEPEWIYDSWWTVMAARPMATYGIPGFVERF